MCIQYLKSKAVFAVPLITVSITNIINLPPDILSPCKVVIANKKLPVYTWSRYGKTFIIAFEIVSLLSM